MSNRHLKDAATHYKEGRIIRARISIQQVRKDLKRAHANGEPIDPQTMGDAEYYWSAIRAEFWASYGRVGMAVVLLLLMLLLGFVLYGVQVLVA